MYTTGTDEYIGDFFMMIRKYTSYRNIFIKKLTNIKNPP